METHTPDKPEIFAMAELLGIDPDLVFAKCFRVWAWFDAHTTNGKTNGSSVSELLVDRMASVNGFAKAMQQVNWLVSEEGGLTLPNFDRHNGETAKGRALTAKRVAKHTNGKTNGESVSPALPREEKRREDISTSLRSVDKPNRKSSLPADFIPCKTAVEKLTKAGLSVESELTKFKDYCEANGIKAISWQAKFRTWASNAVDWKKPSSSKVQDARLTVVEQIMGGLASGNNRQIIDIEPSRSGSGNGARIPETLTFVRDAITGEMAGD